MHIFTVAVTLLICATVKPGVSTTPPLVAQPAFLGDTLAPNVPDTTPPSNANVVVATDAEPQTLNVLLDPIEPWGQQIGALIFDSLAQPDPETGVDTPHLASAWAQSDDHLSLTFTLQQNRVWEDGQPFTADDVVFTFEAIQNQNTRAQTVRNYLEPLASVTKIDASTVRFVLKRASVFAFEAIAQLPIFPKHVYQGGDFNSHPTNRQPLSLGPYRLSSWKGGDKIVLVRNERYPGPAGGAQQLIFKLVADPVKRLQMLRGGTVDVIERLNPTLWLQNTHNAAVAARFWRLRHVPSELQAVGWNNRRPYFANPQVRRALTMLIDRARLVATLRGGVDDVAKGWFNPASKQYNPNIDPWPFAPTGAKALLTEAGWEDHDGDGLRDQGGVTFAFELIYPSGNASYTALAASLAESLADADIRATPVALPWSVYTRRLQEHGFDACLFLWDIAPDSDPYPVWHSTAAAGGENYVNFSDPEADALLEEARQTYDANERNGMYQRFGEILHREEPATLLFNRYHLSLVNKRLAGVVSTPYGVLRLERLYTPSR